MHTCAHMADTKAMTRRHLGQGTNVAATTMWANIEQGGADAVARWQTQR